MSERSKRLALVVAALFVGFAGGELLLRVVSWHPDLVTALRARLLADLHGLHVPRPDRPWLYGLRPGADATFLLQQFCANDLNDPTLHFDASTQLALGAIPDAAYPDPSRRRPPPSRGVQICQRLRTCGVLSELVFHAAPGAPTARELDAAFRPLDQQAPELEWLRARYAETAAFAAARDARFAVVLFPHARHLANAPAPVYGRIIALGRAGGWLTIDLLPAFRRAATSGERVMVDDWHPTPLGHRLAAETIFRALACHGWLPGGAQEACES